MGRRAASVRDGVATCLRREKLGRIARRRPRGDGLALWRAWCALGASEPDRR